MLATIGLLLLPATVGAHLLDHAPPQFQPQSAARARRSCRAARTPTGSSSRRSRPATRTPTSTSSRAAARLRSVGTLGVGPNGGGQTIVQLTDEGRSSRTTSPRTLRLVPDNPRGPGLQHDVEATPKGGAILNTVNPSAVTARGAARSSTPPTPPGRCHDQGALGPRRHAPQGGLEIVDVTDPQAEGDRADEPHRRVAHRQHRPQAPAHRLLGHLGQLSVNADGKRANETRGGEARPRRLRGRRHVLVHELPGRHTVAGSATACRPAGLPLPLPERSRWRQGHANKGTRLRLPRARDLPRRPADVRRAATPRSSST